jgi:hypothetical protein
MINTIVLTTNKSKSMKIVLKRRKHRKGIRPKRKGTLKVRISTLPTILEHCESVSNKMDIYKLTEWNDEFPDANASRSDWNRYFINFERRKQSLLHISKMSRAYGYFLGFVQIQTNSLTTKLVIGESMDTSSGEDIDHMGRCKSCDHKKDCPYTDLDGFDKVQRCPLLRYDFGTYALNKSKAKGPVDLVALAGAALTHLS